MSTNGSTPQTTPEPSRTLRVLAWTVPVLILVQAGLAGPAQFLQPALFEIHGLIGSGVLVVAGLVLVMAFVARQGGGLLLLALLVAAGLFAQIGLGYLGHRAGLTAASAVHIPLGVLLLGLSVAVAMLLTIPQRDG